MFCSVSNQSEMDRKPNCRFCKKTLISGKRIDTVPFFGVSRNKTLLVDSGQDSVVVHLSLYERYRFLLQRRHVEADIGGCSDRSSTGRLVYEL